MENYSTTVLSEDFSYDIPDRKMTENQAKELCTWRYPGEYYIYNCPEWETIIKDSWGLANQKVRQKEFRSVLDEQSRLCGYYRLKEEKGKIMIGLGMRPDLCGQGNGAKLMQLLIQDAKQLYSNYTLHLLF